MKFNENVSQVYRSNGVQENGTINHPCLLDNPRAPEREMLRKLEEEAETNCEKYAVDEDQRRTFEDQERQKVEGRKKVQEQDNRIREIEREIEQVERSLPQEPAQSQQPSVVRHNCWLRLYSNESPADSSSSSEPASKKRKIKHEGASVIDNSGVL